MISDPKQTVQRALLEIIKDPEATIAQRMEAITQLRRINPDLKPLEEDET